jgi:hypothetical protein
MAGELICPDCGGVVGATTTTDAGPPCRCFTAPSGDSSKSDTAVDVAVSAAPPKLCVKCGTDVTGKKRLKDSRGYICYECAKAEQREERGDRTRCKGCGRMVKVSALNNYDGLMICNTCLAERKTIHREQLKRTGIVGVQSRDEKSRVYKLLAVLAFLALIIILQRLHLLPRLF